MKKEKMTQTEKLINRAFTIAKVVLCVYPFAALFYMTSSANTYGLSNSEMLQANPILTVTFLSAMCQAFAAWLLTIVQRRYDDLEYGNALISLILIFIAECLFKNWVGLVACGLLFFLIGKEMPYSFKKEFQLTDKKEAFKDGTGAIVLIILGAFVFWVSMQIGA